ncbi:c-type cytochrome [bacterium]|nr:c-type cytochrome [bacterium]MDB4475005.1 c-type cytochrome [bacterium]
MIVQVAAFTRLTFSNFRFACLLITVVLPTTLQGEETAELTTKDKLVVETVLRLANFDLESSATAKAAVLRYLRAKPGSDRYFELIERFQPPEIAEPLIQYSIANASDTGGVRGAELLFAMKKGDSLAAITQSDNEINAQAAVQLIGHAAGKQTVLILLPLLQTGTATVAVRSAAVKALGKRLDGQQQLMKLVIDGQLADDLKFAAANVLLGSSNTEIASKAAKYLELPATADSQPLPAMAELIKRRGDTTAGLAVFQTTGTCNKCHKVRGKGKEVGPDLSEIGSKLSREAMYVSILDPSAAVSHNFETYSILTVDGQAITGLLISETNDAVTLRNSEGIDKTIDEDDIEIFKKQKTSLMPQDLQKLLTVEQLVDLVEYTLTLKKAGNGL